MTILDHKITVIGLDLSIHNFMSKGMNSLLRFYYMPFKMWSRWRK